MKEFLEKLISRLEEEHERCVNQYGIVGGNLYAFEVSQCIEIVNQLAEEYSHCTLCYLQSPCEYQNADIRVDDSSGWITCSERLPEDCSDVICTTHLKGYTVMNVVVLWYNAKLRKWMNCDDEVVDDNLEVIAWQPLPKPYKE